MPLLSNELRLLPESPQSFVVLEHQGGTQSEVCQLWSENEAVNVFDLGTGRSVSRSRWHTLSSDRPYCLICRGDVELSNVERQECLVAAEGWRAYELVPGSWQKGGLEATLDDVVVFSCKGNMLEHDTIDAGLECKLDLNGRPYCGAWLPEFGLARLSLEDRQWIKATDKLSVEIRTTGSPSMTIHAVRLGLSACQHSIETGGRSARVDCVPLCDRLGDAGLPLDIAIRQGNGRAQFRRLWLPLLVCGFVTRQEGEGWSSARRADKRELNAADLRRRQYRCVPEGVIGKDRQLDDGHWELVIGHHIINSSTTTKPLLLTNGFGLPLRLVNGPLHAMLEPEKRFDSISSAVIDTGVVIEVTMHEDKTSAEMTVRDISEMGNEFELIGLHAGDPLGLVTGVFVESKYIDGQMTALFAFEKQVDLALAVLVYEGGYLGSHWWPKNFLAAFRPGLTLDEAVLLWWLISFAGAPICHEKISPAIVASLLAQPAVHLASIALASHLDTWRSRDGGTLTKKVNPGTAAFWSQALRSILWKAYERVGAADKVLTTVQLKELNTIISGSLGLSSFHEVKPDAVLAFLGTLDSELPKRLQNRPSVDPRDKLTGCKWASEEGEYSSAVESQIATQLAVLSGIPARIWKGYSELKNSPQGKIDLWNFEVAFEASAKFRDYIMSI